MLLRKALLTTLLTLVYVVAEPQVLSQTLGDVRNVLQTLPIPNCRQATTTNTATPTTTIDSRQSQTQNTIAPTFTTLPSTLQTAVSSRPTLDASRLALFESFRRISSGAQQFGLELMTKFSDAIEAQNLHRDFMISPFAIWSLLLLLLEGARGNTLMELRTALRVSESDQAALRASYREVQAYLKINTSTIEVASMQALFTDINQPVLREFEQITERDYGAELIPVNFHEPLKASDYINSVVENATRGLIPYTVLPQNLQNANLVLISSLYFKGQWKHPFNRSLTRVEPFYDEKGNVLGNVEMMVQEASFNYVGINELEGHVLELPYGKENRLSMLIVLPKQGVTVNKVLHNLEKVGIATIFEKLKTAAVGFEDENLEVFLPKFTTSSDFALNSILLQMGVRDVFDPSSADLSKMADNLFVSQMIHSTKIIVNEEGTEAAAATAAVLANKATPPKFYMNRPFIYLILEKSTNLLLFGGQVVNPNNIKFQ